VENFTRSVGKSLIHQGLPAGLIIFGISNMEPKLLLSVWGIAGWWCTEVSNTLHSFWRLSHFSLDLPWQTLRLGQALNPSPALWLFWALAWSDWLPSCGATSAIERDTLKKS